MTFDEFKNDALRTESRPEKINFSLDGLETLLCVAVRVAKLIDTAKKTMFYGKTLDASDFQLQAYDIAMMMDEIGDNADLIANPDLAPDFATTPPNLRILHGAIGMFGESGELLEAIMKQMQGKELDMVNVAEECGDSDWYKAIIHDETGISEDTCRAKVVAKLKARYGDKFSSEAALNRDLVTERAILEETQG